jgi:5-methylcytosine-specific restriction endonuclease McrA
MRGEPFTGPIPKPESRAKQKQRKDRDEDREYWKVRKEVMERDRWRCRACGTPHHVEAHHLKFRSVGGGDSKKNLIVLCRICHAEMHAYRLYAEGEDANKRVRFVKAR